MKFKDPRTVTCFNCRERSSLPVSDLIALKGRLPKVLGGSDVGRLSSSVTLFS